MKSIRVLYDEWVFWGTHGGTSRLFSEVMKNLPEGFEWKLTVVCTPNEFIKAPPFNIPPSRLSYEDFVARILRGHTFPGVHRFYLALGHLFPRLFPVPEVLNRNFRMRELRKGDYDIYHVTAPHWYSFDWKVVAGRKPIVVTVCDLIPEIIAHDGKIAYFRKPLLDAASHIVAITNHTKNDLMRLYNVPEHKISVVHLGANMGDEAGKGTPDLFDESYYGVESGRYALFVGKRSHYKNFNWLLEAMAPFLRGECMNGMQCPPLKLFCTGMPFDASEVRLMRKLRIENRVVQKFVSDDEMRQVFRNAFCFLHPSLYEGFGLPVLDAFASGCPALLANASCFPEVAGDAALYFDPTDVEDFREKFTTCFVPGVRNGLIQKGHERERLFSWKKCAKETSLVYEKVLDEWNASHNNK